MTRFEKESSTLPPAVADGDAEDSLLERWLARSTGSRARVRAAPRQPPPTIPPLGDELADAWFK